MPKLAGPVKLYEQISTRVHSSQIFFKGEFHHELLMCLPTAKRSQATSTVLFHSCVPFLHCYLL